MNNRMFFLLFATAVGFLTLSCNQTQRPFLSQTSEADQNNQTDALKWLHDANPVVDANAAIQKQDFTLLAFAGRATSFPGISSGSYLLQQQCGYRLLANSGDTLRSEKALILRKQLYQYAATYNQLVAGACQKATSKTSP